MNNEERIIKLEDTVNRLEYYIDLLRDYATDPETFLLWDWAISKRLNREQVRKIISKSQEFNKRIKELDNAPKFAEFRTEIEKILLLQPDLEIEVDDNLILQLLKRISNMGMMLELTKYYLQDDKSEPLSDTKDQL
ncbi:hypothetical protein [Paenibacillus pinihumi]|uniref:hypothetical protein n=1 Tax=Paenibacillus pinihumi TaxID=669462 RepID=UPI00040978B8|nr:hypothetical protein [Paenibacillus pinihumi]